MRLNAVEPAAWIGRPTRQIAYPGSLLAWRVEGRVPMPPEPLLDRATVGAQLLDRGVERGRRPVLLLQPFTQNHAVLTVAEQTLDLAHLIAALRQARSV